MYSVDVAQPAGVDFGHRLLDEIERRGGGIGLKIGSGPVALQRVAPAGDLPLQLDLGQVDGLGQIDFHARAGRLHVADVDLAGQGRHPEPRQRAAAGVERQHLAAPADRASGAT